MAEATRSFKRFADWATGSRRDQFSRASLRLAAVDLALTAVLVAVFSAVLYLNLVRNIENNVEGDFGTEAAQTAFVAETIKAIGYDILLVDAGILVVVSVLAYAVARRTLRPVKRNVETQRQFVSNASHELRTPLTILRTEFEVAKRADPASLDTVDLLAPRRTWPTSSSASTARRRRPSARAAEAGWGSRSPSGSSRRTGARFASTAPQVRARQSRSRCRPLGKASAASESEAQSANESAGEATTEEPGDVNLPGGGHADPAGANVDHQFEGVE